MLIAALLLGVQTAPPPVVATDAPPPLAALPSLPPLPWKTAPAVTPDMGDFIADEVRAGRCTLPTGALRMEFAVLVRSDGGVRSVVPRAIACPNVEQYGAGLVTSFARNNLRLPAAGWYHADLTIAWSR